MSGLENSLYEVDNESSRTDRPEGDSWSEAHLLNTGSLEIGPGCFVDFKAIDPSIGKSHPVAIKKMYPKMFKER